MSLDGDIGRVWVIWGLYGARCFGIWQIWVKERAPSLDTKGQTLSPARSGKTFPFSGEPRELINDGNCPNQIFADGISCVIRRRGSKQREFEL